jgi:hypothetical protein
VGEMELQRPRIACMKKRCTSGHVNGRRVFLMLLAAVGPRCAVALGHAVASGLAKHRIHVRIDVLCCQSSRNR